MNIFLDTNILLDVLSRRKPYDVPAGRIWTLAESGAVKAFVSAISYNNVYFIIRKQEGRESAMKAMKLMRRIFQTVAVDERLLDEVIRDSPRDFEDAIQYASALRCRARYLVTRNPSDFPKGGPEIVSAEQCVELVQAIGGR